MQAITIVNDIAISLSDATFITWTKAELTSYLNSAIRRVCLIRPDASSSVESMQLTPGTKQTIPATSRRLLDINRNMGADGLTAGKIITSTDTRSLDLFRPTWHKDTAKISVDHFMYDEETPKTFFVYPPVHATTAVYVEAKLAKDPTEITDVDNDALPIEDVYEQAIQHFMLYLAYDKETDSDHSVTEAKFHYGAFGEIMGLKIKTDSAYTPSREAKEGK